MTEPDERAQVEAEIAEARRELGDTVEELGAKLDVKSRAQDTVAEGKAAVQARGQAVVDTARTTYEERPAAVYGAIGALVALVVGVTWWAVRR